MDNFNNVTEQMPTDQSEQNASAPLPVPQEANIDSNSQFNLPTGSNTIKEDNTQSPPFSDSAPVVSPPPSNNFEVQSFQSAPSGASSFNDFSAQVTLPPPQASSPDQVMPAQMQVASSPEPASITPVLATYPQPQQDYLPSTVETPSKPSLLNHFKDAVPEAPLIMALLFFMAVQSLGSKCKNLCKLDASMRNSIFSGAALGFILTVCMPFFMQHTTDAVLHLSDIYLKNLSHSLLTTFFVFGIGVVLNHTFEKSASHSLMQDVAPSPLMYGMNTFVLCLISFSFAAFLNPMHKEPLFIFIQYVFFFSGIVYVENAMIGNLYLGQNFIIRRSLLCVFACAGLFAHKFLSPLYGLLSYGFLSGFMFYGVLKIEMTAAKRNANYIAFIISFFALAGMNLIFSLHESIRC